MSQQTEMTDVTGDGPMGEQEQTTPPVPPADPVAELQSKVDTLEDALLRARAENQNILRRAAIERSEAIRYANAVAAIKCTRFGGRAGAPTRTEADAFIAAQRATK